LAIWLTGCYVAVIDVVLFYFILLSQMPVQNDSQFDEITEITKELEWGGA
jgi:hypothetical protein